MQSVNLAEMLITGGQWQAVLYCDGGNPDIVFGYRPAFQSQAILDLAVVTGRLAVAGDDGNRCRKFVESGEIASGAGGLLGAII
jgi:hypothetical protein